ncbi:OsmC family protein [Pannonibacter sp.]|uniref:OsmC family protein n=1 Tax=Pannonibacter sp. TaxID=1906786 RepID=UPI003F6F5B39
MTGHIYKAGVFWRVEGDFKPGKYSRGHLWRFDGGVDVPASSSPHVVPLPYSVTAAVDPEEALVAALSSCHMLTFLDLARRGGLMIDAYEDQAEGLMERIAPGRMAITKVTLRPLLTLRASELPDPTWLTDLHDKAHEVCFIANSVKCEISVAPEPVRLVAP